MGFAFYACSPPFSSLLFLFFCLLYITCACMYGCINSIVSTCQSMVMVMVYCFIWLSQQAEAPWKAIALSKPAISFTGKVLFFIITYETVGTSAGKFCSAGKFYMVQRESFIFYLYLWNSWDPGLDVFSVTNTKCPGLKKPWNCARSFAGDHCLRIEDFFFLWQRESVSRCIRQALLGCSML